MIFKELDLLDKDGEVENAKVAPFVDAQIKNLAENTESNAALMTKWTKIMKDSFQNCIKKSTEIKTISDHESGKQVKSVDENLDPVLVMSCVYFSNVAVNFHVIINVVCK